MADQTLAKYVNELRILTILRTQGAATRAEIARRLALTPATVTRLVNSLGERDLVTNIEKPSPANDAREPGRPGVSISLNPFGSYFLGAEIDMGILRLALIDLSANVVHSSETRLPHTLTPQDAVSRIATHLAALQQDSRYAARITGIGVTVPGLVASDGYILNLPILGWKDVNFHQMLTETIDLPCFVENDANAAAFGSVYTQPSLPTVCTIFLKLGRGCGGAAVINGRLLRGANGTAGEIGHMKIGPETHRCSCGQSGCLETFVDLNALARLYRGTDDLTDELFQSLPDDLLADINRGDAAAVAALDSIARWLARGVVSLVNVFNPTTVMLGGMMRPVIEKRIGEIQSHVTASIVPGMLVPEVRVSALGLFECAVGAAAIAHHHAFDISRLDISEHEI